MRSGYVICAEAVRERVDRPGESFYNRVTVSNGSIAARDKEIKSTHEGEVRPKPRAWYKVRGVFGAVVMSKYQTMHRTTPGRASALLPATG